MDTFWVPFGSDGRRRLWVAGGWVVRITFGAWKGEAFVDSGLLRFSGQCTRKTIVDHFLASVRVVRTSRAEVSSGAVDSLERNKTCTRKRTAKIPRAESLS